MDSFLIKFGISSHSTGYQIIYTIIYQINLMLVKKLGENFLIWFIYSTINQVEKFIVFWWIIESFTDVFTSQGQIQNCL